MLFETEAMGLHRVAVARTVAPGAHAVLLPDQAGWPTTEKKLAAPANIILLPLPARAPERNPVGTLWHFSRDSWLGNRIFPSHADILVHCCNAGNILTDRPWRITSIGLRAWTHGF